MQGHGVGGGPDRNRSAERARAHGHLHGVGRESRLPEIGRRSVSIMARRFSRTTVVVCSLFICAGFLHAGDRLELKKELLKATVRAIELELEATRDRLKTAEGGTGPSENVERFTQKLRSLEAEQARFPA